MNGLLLTVDGPSGLGKSTAVAATARALRAAGHTVHTATGPSATPYGQAVRAAAATMRGRALALAVAADRLHQLDTDVRPRRAAGTTVLLDRYLPSTLVLQRADGVDTDFLLAVNEGADVPDLAVLLTADPTPCSAASPTAAPGTASNSTPPPPPANCGSTRRPSPCSNGSATGSTPWTPPT
ncbi:dTMP kinase [Kitasatospora sp. NPDC005856]|uniref:dTMP kinase n=1 Tax=Kitasatospora sp. NPDC005856 TaxID=3154566 RepID=UPI0033D2BC2E